MYTWYTKNNSHSALQLCSKNNVFTCLKSARLMTV